MANDFSRINSLVAHYRFDGDTPYNDRSGKGNHLNYQGGVMLDVVNQHHGDGCGDFEASIQSSLVLPDSALTSNFPGKSGQTNTTFSVSVWFRPESFPANAILVGKYDHSTNKRSWAIAVSDDNCVRAWWGYNSGTNVTGIVSTHVLTAGVWYFVKAVWNDPGNACSIYVYDTSNSTWYLDSATITNALNSEDEPFCIGRSGTDLNRFFDGLVQDVCIFGDVVSDAEAQSIVAGTYDFDGDVNLISRYLLGPKGLGWDEQEANHLRRGGLPYQTGPREDVPALDFLGSSTILGTAWRKDVDLSSGFPGKSGSSNKLLSVCFWVKFRSWPATEYTIPVGKWTRTNMVDSPWRVSTHLPASSRELITGWESGQYAYSGLLPSTGVWYHVAAVLDDANNLAHIRVYDSSSETIYSVTDSGDTTAMPMTAASFSLGTCLGGIGVAIDYQRPTAQYAFDGLIGEVVVFKKALFDSQIDKIRKGIFGAAGVSGLNMLLGCHF